MTKEAKVDLAAKVRTPAPARATSGMRGQPMDLVLQALEARDPNAAKATGLTSAGMRAGAIVRGMRRTAGLSQAGLAARIGVTQERVSELERGAGPQGPTYELLDRIAVVCGMVLMPLKQEMATLIQGTDAVRLNQALTGAVSDESSVQLER
jgi:DNA-binding transcriptional regulator YiaG